MDTMNKETADELENLVNAKFDAQIDVLKNLVKNMEHRTPQYEMINSIKRTFGFMKRRYGKYRSMLYLSVMAGQIEPDDPNLWALSIKTDIDEAIGNQSDPQELLLVESSIEDDVRMDMRYVGHDPDDVFMDAHESVTNTIPDDVLVATNFVAFLDKLRYQISACRVDRTPAARFVLMTLVKKNHVIRLRYNADVPLHNVQKNLEFIHKCQTSAEYIQP